MVYILWLWFELLFNNLLKCIFKTIFNDIQSLYITKEKTIN